MTFDGFAAWIEALKARHLADLRTQEVTRALRALSSLYVERRGALARGGALDSAGKRAAFALFYGPLHYLVARHSVHALGADSPGPSTVIDLGCGTGAVGASWALAMAGQARVLGFDRHPWAVAEASWTYRALRVEGSARRQDLRDVRLKQKPDAVAVGYTANELPDAVRESLLRELMGAAANGSRVLVIEPIAKPKGNWWDEWTKAFTSEGGREDTWRFEIELPDLVRTLDRAAGLDHRVLTARTLYVGQTRRP